MNYQFSELEAVVNRHLMMADKGVVKLLCATVIANRILALNPTWLFIVSNSSGGKSELLSAMSATDGCWEQDDLTKNTFISGAKSHERQTSLLDRLPENAIMVVKDLTLLLNKDPKESHAIFDQLRLIYDEKFYKSFGTGEDVRATPRMGLIAGVTSSIEELSQRMSALGERAIKYYMEQPDRLTVTKVSVRAKKDRQARVEMAEAFKQFLHKDNITIPAELPDLTDDEYNNIAELSEMATSARSAVGRRQFAKDNPISMIHLKEMPMRMAKQLVNISYGLMIINYGPLTPQDQQIIYKVAMDSIPSARKNIMDALTYFSATTAAALAVRTKLPKDTVQMTIDELVALDIVDKELKTENRHQYSLREDYRQLVSRYKGIEMTDKVDLTEEIPQAWTPEPPPEPPPPPEPQEMVLDFTK